eukprot:TRINITY_DN2156_c0_g1_i10.p1 TRINITY_DN2156_c0_g1~~TRINITY_DN2156_c0_g1_i10.p1  ORF type:complete len:1573 (+),score=467.42 TRINITY_DN2156_c0_g1_i10:470-4720(+)
MSASHSTPIEEAEKEEVAQEPDPPPPAIAVSMSTPVEVPAQPPSPRAGSPPPSASGGDVLDPWRSWRACEAELDSIAQQFAGSGGEELSVQPAKRQSRSLSHLSTPGRGSAASGSGAQRFQKDSSVEQSASPGATTASSSRGRALDAAATPKSASQPPPVVTLLIEKLLDAYQEQIGLISLPCPDLVMRDPAAHFLSCFEQTVAGVVPPIAPAEQLAQRQQLEMDMRALFDALEAVNSQLAAAEAQEQHSSPAPMSPRRPSSTPHRQHTASPQQPQQQQTVDPREAQMQRREAELRREAAEAERQLAEAESKEVSLLRRQGEIRVAYTQRMHDVTQRLLEAETRTQRERAGASAARAAAAARSASIRREHSSQRGGSAAASESAAEFAVLSDRRSRVRREREHLNQLEAELSERAASALRSASGEHDQETAALAEALQHAREQFSVAAGTVLAQNEAAMAAQRDAMVEEAMHADSCGIEPIATAVHESRMAVLKGLEQTATPAALPPAHLSEHAESLARREREAVEREQKLEQMERRVQRAAAELSRSEREEMHRQADEYLRQTRAAFDENVENLRRSAMEVRAREEAEDDALRVSLAQREAELQREIQHVMTSDSPPDTPHATRSLSQSTAPAEAETGIGMQTGSVADVNVTRARSATIVSEPVLVSRRGSIADARIRSGTAVSEPMAESRRGSTADARARSATAASEPPLSRRGSVADARGRCAAASEQSVGDAGRVESRRGSIADAARRGSAAAGSRRMSAVSQPAAPGSSFAPESSSALGASAAVLDSAPGGAAADALRSVQAALAGAVSAVRSAATAGTALSAAGAGFDSASASFARAVPVVVSGVGDDGALALPSAMDALKDLHSAQNQELQGLRTEVQALREAYSARDEDVTRLQREAAGSEAKLAREVERRQAAEALASSSHDEMVRARQQIAEERQALDEEREAWARTRESEDSARSSAVDALTARSRAVAEEAAAVEARAAAVGQREAAQSQREQAEAGRSAALREAEVQMARLKAALEYERDSAVMERRAASRPPAPPPSEPPPPPSLPPPSESDDGAALLDALARAEAAERRCAELVDETEGLSGQVAELRSANAELEGRAEAAEGRADAAVRGAAEADSIAHIPLPPAPSSAGRDAAASASADAQEQSALRQRVAVLTDQLRTAREEAGEAAEWLQRCRTQLSDERRAAEEERSLARDRHAAECAAVVADYRSDAARAHAEAAAALSTIRQLRTDLDAERARAAALQQETDRWAEEAEAAEQHRAAAERTTAAARAAAAAAAREAASLGAALDAERERSVEAEGRSILLAERAQQHLQTPPVSCGPSVSPVRNRTPPRWVEAEEERVSVTKRGSSLLSEPASHPVLMPPRRRSSCAKGQSTSSQSSRRPSGAAQAGTTGYTVI